MAEREQGPRGRGNRPSRLGAGATIYTISALALFLFMFLDWYGTGVTSVSGFSGEVPGGGTAWEALSVIPLFLMLAIVAAVGAALARRFDFDPGLPLAPNAVVSGLGVLATVLILFRILVPPDAADFGGVGVDVSLRTGAFLALLAAAGIAYGGWRAMREEGLTFGGAAERLASSDKPSSKGR